MDASLHCPGKGTGTTGSQLCIIVCGLHRSGTSAVTRVINLLGADIADDLVPTRPDNIRGYWESGAVVAIHDRLLSAIAAAYADPLDPLLLQPGWLATRAAQQAKRELADVLTAEFADSSAFVVKDPRMSRLLPLWIALAQTLALAPIVVIPFRNPLEVAASLARRDRASLPQALLLYFHSYLETELASRAVPRLFVRYDHLVHDWRPFATRLGSIAGGLGQQSRGVAAEIDEFLSDELYHHRCDHAQLERNREVPRMLVEMFDAMCRAADGGPEGALRASFDRLRTSAADAAGLYQGLVLAERTAARQDLAQVREAFESSTCWRITAPLRWIKLSLRRTR